MAMENLKLKHEHHQRRRGLSNSPDFQFWMVRNPSFPQPDLASADELFVNGVLLPLHLREPPTPDPPVQLSDSALTRDSTTSGSSFTSSKRWRDLFSKKDKSDTATHKKDKEIELKEKKKKKKLERKSQRKTTSGSGTELNINIWPFSRSRSAGNNATRPRVVAPATRKVSSAPCSRSNSAGESKSRKWPTSSPGRPGVHVGRSSPVWQVRRGPLAPVAKISEPVVRNVEQGVKKEGSESSAAQGGSKLNIPAGRSCRHIKDGSGGHIFNLRSLFTKRVY